MIEKIVTTIIQLIELEIAKVLIIAPTPTIGA